MSNEVEIARRSLHRFRPLVCLGLCWVMAMVGSGCAGSANSPRQVSAVNRDLARGSLSAVEVQGHERALVTDTVEEVFTEAGLKLVSHTLDTQVFERPATGGEIFAYGTWSGGPVVIRLKVECLQQGGAVYLLRCFSFIARDAGTMAEDEQRLDRNQVRKYRHLLQEVAQRLKS